MTSITISRPVHTNPRCLHCLLHCGIERWAEKTCERNPAGLPIIDISEVVARLAEVIADMIGELPDGPQRAQWEKYARGCLEAAFEAKRTGKFVEVDTGTPEGLQ